MRPTRPLLAAASLAAASLIGASGGTAHATASHKCPLPKFGPGSHYHPTIHPKNFSPNITNPWYPLPVGTTYIYRGVDGKTKIVDIVAASHRTKKIDGVVTRAVNDRVLIHGRVRERTVDFYTQDRCGNIWYFGERTAELNRHGKVTSTSGTFRAGVHGAQPGVYIQAHPTIGRKFRQEWKPGQAEDSYKALSKHASLTVPYGSYQHVLRTKETDSLEPGVVDNKFYAYGIGSIEEVTVKGPTERLKLVDVLH
ncbi:MAG: hypothetical protein JO246_02950 [Frankiaceae bacterium]|nr:hypothetical protein [Frankiaceae bacterium]MBV9869764.1 hypothetical protein [Frankiaceae bacterium]